MSSQLQPIADYFRNDPLRILTLIGGSGGALYWYDRIRSGPVAKFHWIEERKPSESGISDFVVEFEIENIGNVATSVNPDIWMSGFTISSASKFCEARYLITDTDRILEPYRPRVFAAHSDTDTGLTEPIFRVFHISFSKGKTLKVRRRSFFSPTTMAPIEYWKELLRFKMAKKVEKGFFDK